MYVYPNVSRFLIFEILCLDRSKTLPCLKIISQKWTTFVFGNTYLHQTLTECVLKKLWKALWLYCVFLGIFMHYYWPYMLELLCLYQTFTDYMSNQYPHTDIFIYQWLQVMEYLLTLLRFLRILHTIDEYSCYTYVQTLTPPKSVT